MCNPLLVGMSTFPSEPSQKRFSWGSKKKKKVTDQQILGLQLMYSWHVWEFNFTASPWGQSRATTTQNTQWKKCSLIVILLQSRYCSVLLFFFLVLPPGEIENQEDVELMGLCGVCLYMFTYIVSLILQLAKYPIWKRNDSFTFLQHTN